VFALSGSMIAFLRGWFNLSDEHENLFSFYASERLNSIAWHQSQLDAKCGIMLSKKY